MWRKRVSSLIVTGCVLALSLGTAAQAQIRLRMHGGCLQLPLKTVAPVVIYDGIPFAKATEEYNVLCPVGEEVPRMAQVVVPANTRKVLIDGKTYAIDPQPVERTISIRVGTKTVIAFKPTTIYSTVYVSCTESIPPGTDIYFIPQGVRGDWIETNTTVADGNAPHILYVPATAPRGIVYHGGIWQPSDTIIGNTTITITVPQRSHHSYRRCPWHRQPRRGCPYCEHYTRRSPSHHRRTRHGRPETSLLQFILGDGHRGRDAPRRRNQQEPHGKQDHRKRP